MTKFIRKSKKVMQSYIALHSLVPKNELPKRLRGKIPKNQVWVRSDIYDDLWQFVQCQKHEEYEIELMKNGMPYKEAHRRAEIVDGLW